MQTVSSDFSIASREAPGNSAAHRLGVIDAVADEIGTIERRPLRVLDAGAGRMLRLRLPSERHVTGIDVSEEALRNHSALDRMIIGDLQTFPLERAAYDLVVCWDVLEHLADPEAALANMAAALAAGGLLVVGCPNVWSLKAWVAKLTPFRFHLWAYRSLLGKNDAGLEGNPPFRTYLRLAIAPRRLERLASSSSLEHVWTRFYVSDSGDRLPSPLRQLWLVANAAFVALAAPFNVRPGMSDCCLVFRKRSTS
jgi:SAM-dependent methyltransferase